MVCPGGIRVRLGSEDEKAKKSTHKMFLKPSLEMTHMYCRYLPFVCTEQ